MYEKKIVRIVMTYLTWWDNLLEMISWTILSPHSYERNRGIASNLFAGIESDLKKTKENKFKHFLFM